MEPTLNVSCFYLPQTVTLINCRETRDKRQLQHVFILCPQTRRAANTGAENNIVAFLDYSYIMQKIFNLSSQSKIRDPWVQMTKFKVRF